MKPFAWVDVTSEQQATAQLAEGGGAFAIKAGGVDVIEGLRLGLTAPARLVNILPIAALGTVAAEGRGLRIGAAVTLARLVGEPLLLPALQAVAEAAASAATPQIRNRATVAGNLLQRPRCGYYLHPDFTCLRKGGATCFAEAGDNRHHAILGGGPSHIVHPSTLATALSCVEARLVIAASGQAPREVALADFFVLPAESPRREHRLGPGELVTAVVIPEAAGGARSAYRAVKERSGNDRPLVEVAVSIARRGEVVDRARVVLGGAAPIPWRSREAEAVVVGRALTPALANEAAAVALAGARPLSGNGYKVPLLRALIARALLAAVAPE